VEGSREEGFVYFVDDGHGRRKKIMKNGGWKLKKGRRNKGER